VLGTINPHQGLSPIRLRPCRAHNIKAFRLQRDERLTSAVPLLLGFNSPTLHANGFQPGMPTSVSTYLLQGAYSSNFLP
jgi:hypothetical protein